MFCIGNLFQMDVAVDKLNHLQNRKDFKSGYYLTLKTDSIFDKLETFEESWYESNVISDLLNKIDFSSRAIGELGVP